MGHTLEYPKNVKERLTARFEVNEITNPGEVELWLHSDQANLGIIRAYDLYEGLKQDNLRERSLSYGHLIWFEKHPEQIPTTFIGKKIFGWGTIVRATGGLMLVPYLECSKKYDSSWVGWESTDWALWLETMPAGLIIQ